MTWSARLLSVCSLIGCSAEPDLHPPEGHFGGNEHYLKAYAAPTKLLEKAAGDKATQAQLNELVLRRCDDLERSAPRFEEVAEHLSTSHLFVDDTFNRRIRLFGCAEVLLYDDSTWFRYSFQDDRWRRGRQ